MGPDLATRVYNHTFRIDPIVRTLLESYRQKASKR